MIALEDIKKLGYTQEEAEMRFLFLQFYEYDETKDVWRMMNDGQGNNFCKSK